MKQSELSPLLLSFYLFPDMLCNPTDLILPTSFGSKRHHLRWWWLVAQPSSMVSMLRFSSAVRQMPGDVCTTSAIISLSPLLPGRCRCDWCNTRGRCWWHCHTSLEVFLAIAHGSMDNNNSKLNLQFASSGILVAVCMLLSTVWHSSQNFIWTIFFCSAASFESLNHLLLWQDLFLYFYL